VKRSGVANVDPGSSDRALFYLFVAVLIWAPWPLASNRPWAASLLEVWVFSLVGVWLWRARVGLVSPTLAFRLAWPLSLALAFWLLYGLLQVIPVPAGLVKVLSPYAYRQWASSAEALHGRPVGDWLTFSLDPYSSWTEWRLGITLYCVLALTLLLVRSRRRLRLLGSALVVAALAQATVASLLLLAGKSWWFTEPQGRATGTFANPNHLAGFLEINLALGIGLLVADLSDATRFANWRQRVRAWAGTLLGRKARLRIYLAIMVVALVMTGSRMGNTAFFASLAIAGAIGIAAFRRSSRPVVVLLVSLVLVDLLILGSWFGLDRVRERIEDTVLTEEARYRIGVQGADYLRDYLWVGSGGGSFSVAYPAYRLPDNSPAHFAHADNDILEFQLEYGLVGSVLLTVSAALSLGAALRVLWGGADPLLRGMAFACLMGMTAILVHSTADANLRMPSNAALFMVLMALPWIGLSLKADRSR
jgi:hypothetical protein